MIRNLVVLNSLVLTLVGMPAVRAVTHVADSQGDPFSGEAVRTWFEKLKHMYASQGINWTPIPRQVLKAASSESPEGVVDLTIDMEEAPDS